MLPLEKALALVVRATDWSETSRVVTLFTRSFGKVRALAKGGRRLKSNFDQAFDLLTVCDVVFIKKSGESLDLLTEARVHERFPILRHNWQALNIGYYVAELLSDGTQDYDPHEGLFDFSLETLRSLGSDGFSAAETIAKFELAWLRELGYSPRLETCSACEKDLLEGGLPSTLLAFSAAVGGVLCADCRSGVRDQRPLSWDGWQALRELAAGGGRIRPGCRRELRWLLAQCVTGVLGRRPRLLNAIEADLFGPGGA